MAAMPGDAGSRTWSTGGGSTRPSSTRLGINAVPVNAEMDTGVPWCSAVDDDPVTLLTESGNFGKQVLLVRAATVTELG